MHFNVRLEEERLCCLVIVGVRRDGKKELVAIADGYRESTDSWAALLRDLRHRDMRAPVVAVGDGALGFWAALRDVFPETKEQRCWVHKCANILDALPKSIQPLAKTMLTEVRDAEDREHARDAAKAFDNEFHVKWPKAAQKLRDDLGPLLCFFDFPAEHWVHLKTANPIVISSCSWLVHDVQHVLARPGALRRGRGYLPLVHCADHMEERCRSNGWRHRPVGSSHGRCSATTTSRSSRSNGFWPICRTLSGPRTLSAPTRTT